jgi:hypothetical protein
MSTGSGPPTVQRLPVASIPGLSGQQTPTPAAIQGGAVPAGLLAYGLYKLARRDWSDAFLARHRREPQSEDIEAFILGELTPSRIAGYRQQAEARLAALAPVLPAASSSAPVAVRPGDPMDQPKPRLKDLMIRLALLLVAVVVVGLMIRFLVVKP